MISDLTPVTADATLLSRLHGTSKLSRTPILTSVPSHSWWITINSPRWATSYESPLGAPLHPKLSCYYMLLIPKTIGNRKRDCVWGCARGINTTWENLQIEKHKSVRWAEITPSWFVLFDLQIFSGGVYPPSATSRTISFLLPIVFGINLIHFFDEKKDGGAGNSIVCFGASIPFHAIWQKQNEERKLFRRAQRFWQRKVWTQRPSRLLNNTLI